LRRQPRSSRDIIFVPLVSTTCGIPGQSKMTANEIPGICCDDSVCVCVRAYICIDKSVFFLKKKTIYLQEAEGSPGVACANEAPHWMIRYTLSHLSMYTYIYLWLSMYIHISVSSSL
jgi:hypothetical protein